MCYQPLRSDLEAQSSDRMNNRRIIFVGGLHRSGTSLIHETLRSHPEISGFQNTGVPEDEGQHLQTVYLPARVFGGPGRFGFDEASFMDDQHPLATEYTSAEIFRQWSRHWNTARPYLIEKSPPNLVRTRFLQKIFPRASFVIVVRHPLAVSYATKKWSKTGIPSLLEHFFRCHERFRDDMPFLKKVLALRYEDFVREPDRTLCALFEWIGLEPISAHQEIKSEVNKTYFTQWERERRSFIKNNVFGFRKLLNEYEARANAFGYSVTDTQALLPVSWLEPARYCKPGALEAQSS